MLYSRILLIIVWLLTLPLASTTSAESTAQTRNFTGAPGFSETLSFSCYTGPLAEIQSITVEYGFTIQGGILNLDNDGISPAFFTVELGAGLNASSADVSLLDSTLQPVFGDIEALYVQTVVLAGNVGDGLHDFDPSGPDGVSIHGTSQTENGGAEINSLFWAQYVSGAGGSGDASFEIDLTSDQIANTGGIGGIEYAVTPVSASGWVRVTFEWAPLPPQVTITGIESNGDTPVLQWQGNLTNLVYMVESSTNLQTSEWSPVTPTSQWWITENTWTNTGSARSREFFRIKAKEQ